MSDKTEKPETVEDSFIQRWSRRKLEQKSTGAAAPSQHTDLSNEATSKAPDEPVIHESDLPPVDTLNEDSEVGMFFGEGISEKLRQQALRKLFHFEKFNVVDGLDDYAEDYTIFQPLYHLYSSREDIQKITGIASEFDETEADPHNSAGTNKDETVASELPAERADFDDNDFLPED